MSGPASPRLVGSRPARGRLRGGVGFGALLRGRLVGVLSGWLVAMRRAAGCSRVRHRRSVRPGAPSGHCPPYPTPFRDPWLLPGLLLRSFLFSLELCSRLLISFYKYISDLAMAREPFYF